ncbi:hypothetical protein [Photobacterium kishitanii]|uniref:Uncharacterized protein n=1 Tax=Photobacterium kishitanii TaxID=318456 RepID=A0A2T3KM27_9GAMM|nr:hypothetical protein [Photobacterium kishitanii]PSV00736.1 hypothetical protein C9J27_06230 [Photobacterium kishitanii]
MKFPLHSSSPAIIANYSDGRVVFSGGADGNHSIICEDIEDEFTQKRIEAHWAGYCKNNEVFPISYFSKWSLMKQAIIESRAAARQEVRDDGYPCMRGNGSFCCASDLQNTIVAIGDGYEVDLTKTNIILTINTILSRYPAVTEITIEGTVDAAESVNALANGDYCPSMSSWSIVIWQKGVANCLVEL